MSNESPDIDDVYEDRNLAAMLAAAVVASTADTEPLAQSGWYIPDDDGYDEDWPVVWLIPDPEIGQVSFHVTPEDRALLEASPIPHQEPPGGFDGHTKTDVHDRLRRFLGQSRGSATHG